MRYCGLIKNDMAASPGVGVTLFVSGCDAHCPGCHNPEAQNYEYGEVYTVNTTFEIIKALQSNNINRNLNIMGGEPLAPRNRACVASLIMDIKNALPNTKVYIWTGYTYEYLINEIENGV